MITFENGEIKASEYLLSIPCFKNYYEQDKTKEKKKFYDLLLYLFFMYDTRSPYVDYPEHVRLDIVKRDVFSNSEINISNKALTECKAVYQNSKPVEAYLTEKALSTAYKLAEYLDTISFSEKNEDGDLTTNPKDIVAILKSIGDIISSLKTLRKQSKQASSDEVFVEKELFEDM